MYFISLQFAAVVLLAMAAYWFAPRRYRGLILTVVSYGYYATWSWRWVVLMAICSTAALLAGQARAKRGEKSGGRIIGFAVWSFIALLCLFKFGAEAWLAMGQGFPNSVAIMLVLPIGFSYYTYRICGYLIEIHWERIKPAERWTDFFAYVSFFPCLIAGPIQGAKDFSSQLADARLSFGLVEMALLLVAFGVLKKLFVANTAADLMFPLLGAPEGMSNSSSLLACYGQAVWIYADFSAISDIALGVGLLFGIRAPQNFENPYYGTSVVEFWRRWHISLSTWLRDYLFTSLRMRLRNFGQVGLVLAIMMNMFVIGIWHGADPKYAVFGLINGVIMAASTLAMRRKRLFLKEHKRLSAVHNWLAPVIVFHIILIPWTFFGANDVSSAWRLLTHGAQALAEPIQTLGGISAAARGALAFLAALAAMECVHLCRTNQKVAATFWRAHPIVRALPIAVAVALIWSLDGIREYPFIYQKF